MHCLLLREAARELSALSESAAEEVGLDTSHDYAVARTGCCGCGEEKGEG